VTGRRAVDASGEGVAVLARPERIVSLVPSVTETLFALGLGDRVVGVTDWCIHPAPALADRPRVGGTKNPRIEAIAALRPDLVLANLEENRAIDVRRLRERGLCTWVDYPRTVPEALVQIEWLADLGAAAEVRAAIVDPIRAALERAARRTAPARSVFVAVWKDPWMSLSVDTYADDLLARAGLRNVFADAVDRYPRVDLAEVARRDPEIVLLPDEPYRFSEDDVPSLAEALADTRAARNSRLLVVDGTLVFWHGPRIAPALEMLVEIAQR
jgi:ABC-type Fe3+-hydroxamate transport system substrate-binding protein